VINPVDFQGTRILPAGIKEALQEVIQYIPRKKGDYFCFANIHVVMESQKNNQLKEALDNATGNFADGMGVAWALKILGNKFRGRVRGADLMFELCEYASKHNLKIYFFGNTEETLSLLKEKFNKLYPGLILAGSISPPFRALTKEEDASYVKQINDSNADILFVSLGAPKQEKWMYEHKGRIKAVQFGVGAAFCFIAGKIKQAPKWMQKTGFEWLYRMPQEPRKTIYRMSLVPAFALRTLIQFAKNKKK